MSVIDELSRMFDGVNEDYLTVHEERCIGIRNRHAGCLRCVEACAGGALNCDEEESITVDAARCIGCGSCATACPTSAIEIHSPSDAELMTGLKESSRRTDGHPVIACEMTGGRGAHEGSDEPASGGTGSGTKSGALVVPCLGRADETVPLMAAAWGCHDLTLAHGNCESCTHGHGGALAREVRESAGNLLAAFGSQMRLESIEEPGGRSATVDDAVAGAAVPNTTRDAANPSDAATATADAGSDALGSPDRPASTDAEARGSATPNRSAPREADMAPGAYRKVGRDGTLSHALPTRRTVMYNCLKHIGAPVAAEVDQRVIGAVDIDPELCNSCRMCTVFCPTGALAKVDEEGRFGVEHRSSACLQCRLCEHICPTRALTVSSRVPIGQFMGETTVFQEMKKPSWEANCPDSMFRKVHHVIGDELEMGVF